MVPVGEADAEALLSLALEEPLTTPVRSLQVRRCVILTIAVVPCYDSFSDSRKPSRQVLSTSLST